ncbi:carcinoembryonic antigen-related cell adhesion molecule 6-like [Apodemus sylvaticus]|uniref:carcinoembryonic antigen-related cell adhesion molecule 6-like n=1 Tax=Apodemus sylvaticus TaxID=10129 RepID=UPI002242AF83|nr:carcinoembryonic antigen-related cell adhesion molecule 6-like [Apodemus sylvaticus]
MEPPSALPPTRVPWQGLLLTASLLTIWNMPTASAEPTVESVPPAVLEGKNVLLLAHDLPDSLLAYQWFKGNRPMDKDLIITYEIKSQETKQGKLYSGRETLYPNGSLALQNVTLKQSGLYTINIRSADDQKSAFIEVSVYPLLSKPSVRSNRNTAVEGQDAVELTCEPSFRKTTYLWFLNGKMLHGDEGVILSRGNATLTLLKVSRHFGGRYECEVKNPMSAFHSDPFTLDVYYGPDTPEIFPPHKYFEEGQSMWLSCQTVSHPKAHYSWNVNGEPWNSRQEISIHQVSISNNGLYTCLVNNPATGRNNSKVKEVVIVEKLPKPHIQVTNETVLEHHLVDLTCVSENTTGVSIWWTFNNQKLKATDRVSFSWNNRRLTIDPVTKEDAGTYQCGVSNPLDTRQSDPVKLAVLYRPSQRSRFSPLLLAGLAAEILAGMAILGGLTYFAFFKKLDKARSNSILSEDTPTLSTQAVMRCASRISALGMATAASFSHTSHALEQRRLPFHALVTLRSLPSAGRRPHDNSPHEASVALALPVSPQRALQAPGTRTIAVASRARP